MGSFSVVDIPRLKARLRRHGSPMRYTIHNYEILWMKYKGSYIVINEINQIIQKSLIIFRLINKHTTSNWHNYNEFTLSYHDWTTP